MLKHFFAALLSLFMLFSLASCAKTEQAPAATEEETKPEAVETAPKESEELLPEIEYDRVDTPLTRARVDAIPIAKEGMTSEELRQICVDYVKLSVSFQWVPNMDFSYKANQSDEPVEFYEGVLHGGIPYINTASGNLYRMLEFYDPETGILDVRYLSQNTKIFGTACSGTTGWGWNRVINSASMAWTHDLNASNGLIPVGPYDYDLSTTAYGEDGKEDCKDIAHRNGEQTMYESYALSLKADCFVNNGHVRMNREDPVVVRNADGSINGEESYVIQVEQGLFVTHENHDRVSADGVPYKVQGNEGYKRTFKELYKDGYLPHTFKEFHGQDPIEPGEASIGITGESITGDDLMTATCTANYVISDVFLRITDPEGTELVNFAKRSTNHFSRELKLEDSMVRYLANLHGSRGNTLTVLVQLGTGELVTAYSGTLLK